MDQPVIKAALQYIEKRINTAADKIVGAISKIKVEQADIKIEKVDLSPVVKQLQALNKKEIKFPPVDKPVDNGAVLVAILEAIMANKPETGLREEFDAFGKSILTLKPKDEVTINPKQMQGLMAALTGGGGGTKEGPKSATNWAVETVALTSADTEYTYTFPANTVSWTLKLRASGAVLYYASSTGKLPVSGDNSDYLTLPSLGTRSQDGVEWGGKKIYFESDTATQVVELDVFTM